MLDEIDLISNTQQEKIKLKNVHPGEILNEEFLSPLGISQNKLAKDMRVSPRRINEIVHALRSITTDTDLRLSRALGTSEGFWLGLQSDYDLEAKKTQIKAQLKLIGNLVRPSDLDVDGDLVHC